MMAVASAGLMVTRDLTSVVSRVSLPKKVSLISRTSSSDTDTVTSCEVVAASNVRLRLRAV